MFEDHFSGIENATFSIASRYRSDFNQSDVSVLPKNCPIHYTIPHFAVIHPTGTDSLFDVQVFQVPGRDQIPEAGDLSSWFHNLGHAIFQELGQPWGGVFCFEALELTIPEDEIDVEGDIFVEDPEDVKRLIDQSEGEIVRRMSVYGRQPNGNDCAAQMPFLRKSQDDEMSILLGSPQPATADKVLTICTKQFFGGIECERKNWN